MASHTYVDGSTRKHDAENAVVALFQGTDLSEMVTGQLANRTPGFWLNIIGIVNETHDDKMHNSAFGGSVMEDEACGESASGPRETITWLLR